MVNKKIILFIVFMLFILMHIFSFFLTIAKPKLLKEEKLAMRDIDFDLNFIRNLHLDGNHLFFAGNKTPDINLSPGEMCIGKYWYIYKYDILSGKTKKKRFPNISVWYKDPAIYTDNYIYIFGPEQKNSEEIGPNLIISIDKKNLKTTRQKNNLSFSFHSEEEYIIRDKKSQKQYLCFPGSNKINGEWINRIVILNENLDTVYIGHSNIYPAIYSDRIYTLKIENGTHRLQIINLGENKIIKEIQIPPNKPKKDDKEKEINLGIINDIVVISVVSEYFFYNLKSNKFIPEDEFRRNINGWEFGFSNWHQLVTFPPGLKKAESERGYRSIFPLYDCDWHKFGNYTICKLFPRDKTSNKNPLAIFDSNYIYFSPDNIPLCHDWEANDDFIVSTDWDKFIYLQSFDDTKKNTEKLKIK